MQILAHRGYWLTPNEKNSREAINRAFKHNLGIETDVRDLNGELVISHDLPEEKGCLPLISVLEDYLHTGCSGLLGLNIKADGLSVELKKQLEIYGIRNYFCFDMSVPDTFPYFHLDMIAAARLSEYEPEGKLSAIAPVLWVDGFHDNPDISERLRGWLQIGKKVCLVSPELHGREPDSLWKKLLELPINIIKHPDLMLCTDYPIQAQRVFKL